MHRRQFLQTSFAVLPVLSLPPTLGEVSGPPSGDPRLIAFERYKREPTPGNARAVSALIPAAPGQPIPAPFTESVEWGVQTLEAAVTAGDVEAARLAFRLRDAVYPGSVRSWLNEVIGRFISVEPGQFLELLAEHPHLIGYSKILLNLGLDLVDDFEGQRLEVNRRIRAIESVRRDDLRSVQREVLQILYGDVHVCSH